MSKGTLENKFFGKRLKIKQNCEIWSGFLDEL